MLAAAITRELEIIGEAVNALSEDFKTNHREIPWKDDNRDVKQIDTRYFNVNPDIILQTAIVAVPELLQVIWPSPTENYLSRDGFRID